MCHCFPINISSLLWPQHCINTSIIQQTKHRYRHICACVCIAWQEPDADTKISASQFPFSFATESCSFCVFSYETTDFFPLSLSLRVISLTSILSRSFFALLLHQILICLDLCSLSLFILSSIAGIISIEKENVASVSSSNWILQSYIQLCHLYSPSRYIRTKISTYSWLMLSNSHRRLFTRTRKFRRWCSSLSSSSLELSLLFYVLSVSRSTCLIGRARTSSSTDLLAKCQHTLELRYESREKANPSFFITSSGCVVGEETEIISSSSIEYVEHDRSIDRIDDGVSRLKNFCCRDWIFIHSGFSHS